MRGQPSRGVPSHSRNTHLVAVRGSRSHRLKITGDQQASLVPAMASSSFDDDASPERVSQPFVKSGHVEMNIGMFNLGIAQNQFEEGEVHLLTLCEVGGHKQGAEAGGGNTKSITDEART